MIYDKNILIVSKNFTETKLTLFYVLKNNKKVLIPLVVSTNVECVVCLERR